MPKQTRSAATIAAALNTLFVMLMKTTRDKKQLNGKEGMVMMKEAQTPPTTASATKSPKKEAQEV